MMIATPIKMAGNPFPKKPKLSGRIERKTLSIQQVVRHIDWPVVIRAKPMGTLVAPIAMPISIESGVTLSKSAIGRLRPLTEDTCCGCSWCRTDRSPSPECASRRSIRALFNQTPPDLAAGRWAASTYRGRGHTAAVASNGLAPARTAP